MSSRLTLDLFFLNLLSSMLSTVRFATLETMNRAE